MKSGTFKSRHLAWFESCTKRLRKTFKICID